MPLVVFAAAHVVGNTGLSCCYCYFFKVPVYNFTNANGCFYWEMM